MIYTVSSLRVCDEAISPIFPVIIGAAGNLINVDIVPIPAFERKSKATKQSKSHKKARLKDYFFLISSRYRNEKLRVIITGYPGKGNNHEDFFCKISMLSYFIMTLLPQPCKINPCP
jgi:hypothetical protein